MNRNNIFNSQNVDVPQREIVESSSLVQLEEVA